MSILNKCFLIFLITCACDIPVLADSDEDPGIKILQGNDDGWAESNIRTLYEVLKREGHQTIISAPVQNKSGSGSRSKDWEALTKPGEYQSVPSGAPGTGQDPDDERIWYVNAYPADGIRFGLDTLTPRFYDGKPDLVISGPNVGTNIAFQNYFSGTIGAAAFAAKKGIPAIAISAADGNRHSYADRSIEDSSFVYANVTTRILKDLLQVDEPGPYLPEGCILNINLQKAGPKTNCQSASDYKFALTTIFGIKYSSGINHCGTESLPGEASIITRGDGCWASVTVVQSGNLLDGSPEQKQFILDRSDDFFSCPAKFEGKESTVTQKMSSFGSNMVKGVSQYFFE